MLLCRVLLSTRLARFSLTTWIQMLKIQREGETVRAPLEWSCAFIASSLIKAELTPRYRPMRSETPSFTPLGHQRCALPSWTQPVRCANPSSDDHARSFLGGDLNFNIPLNEEEEYLDDAGVCRADADAPVAILAEARFLGVAPPLETGNGASFEFIRIKASLSPSPSVIRLEICKRGMLRAKMVDCLGGETSRCFPSISKDELVVFKPSVNCCSSERAKGQRC